MINNANDRWHGYDGSESERSPLVFRPGSEFHLWKEDGHVRCRS